MSEKGNKLSFWDKCSQCNDPWTKQCLDYEWPEHNTKKTFWCEKHWLERSKKPFTKVREKPNNFGLNKSF